MNLAVASGKGGTGKTTVATNLARALAKQGVNARYLDCDVEEPNGHLFLKPRIAKTEAASIPVPVIDESACDACGECVHLCQYRALILLGKTVMVFAELCHGCGGCMQVCPRKAITEKAREIGVVETGTCGDLGFVQGRLNVGEAMSPPLIRQVLTQARPDADNIVDAPPGTSCPMVSTMRNADFVILVTEPTPFGLYDLGLALDVVRELGLPRGVVVNRGDGSRAAADFCAERTVEMLVEIPDDRRIAEACSRGEMICETVPGIAERFDELWKMLADRVKV